MSVTSEDVSGAHNIPGGGATPTTIPRQTPIASSAIVTPTISNGPSSGNHPTPTTSGSSSVSTDVVKSGYLRKLKGKKKFFVLRKETDADKPARLEYYANEKKFRMGHPPKKSIVLKACFNISGPESKLKSKYSVSLHTHNDCVRISMNSEEETNEWLRVMKALAGEDEDDHASEGKLHFEHIWMVHALNKGLGSKENIIGPYRLCLTSKELTLLKIGDHDGRNALVKFPLNVIRNVSHDATFGCFFHIELGRLALTGPGQLSLKTDDNNIAQNMHVLILKAMQNYSKDDIIPPRERARTYTWATEANMRSSHNTPPGFTCLSSIDEPPRIRTDSMPSSAGRVIGMSQMSPPVPILSSPPSILFNSPNMYSTGTDSTGSSYSIDYDNNNHSHGGNPDSYPKSNDEEESYVPYYPREDQQHISKNLGNLKLPLNPDMSDYVEVDASVVSKDSTSSTAQTPSSYMEMQSPMSPFDNYIPMSPAVPSAVNSSSGVKYNGKISISHSRNSSLIEDNDGYVPMIPGHHSRSESGAGSTAGSATGLDDAYLDMDFGRKMNLSNDDVRRVSPASSESLQSNTPSSDFPLEKVTSYLTDDFDDSMRPMRAYSVGSRSDTSSAGKLRGGRNRLEAVQETFRIRAMSVGSKNPRKNPIQSNTTSANVGAVGSKPASGPLSSSWSGSTGRWPLSKFAINHHYSPNQNQHYTPTYSHSHATSESADSDLMELDFSKNKKSRKRSLPGPPASLNSTSSSAGSSNIHKLSPAPKGTLANSLSEVSPSSETYETLKSPQSSVAVESSANRNYVASAPISIKGCNRTDPSYSFVDPGSQSILTRLTGTDLKKLKELDDEGAYLDMDFSSNSKTPEKNRDIVDLNDTTLTAPSTAKLALNLPTTPSANPPSKVSVESASLCNGDVLEVTNSGCANGNKSPYPSDKVHPPTVSEHAPTSLQTSGLTRIEESPEKQEHSKASSGSITPQSPSRCTPNPIINSEDDQVTYYAAIEHPACRSPTAASSTSCGTAAASSKAVGVTYAQIDFVKSAESVKPNS